MDDYATTTKHLDVSFWATSRGQHTAEVITLLEKHQLPDKAIDAIKEAMHLQVGSDNRLIDLNDFNASAQAVKLANILNQALNYYMPGGFIDENKASASDIKNLMTTGANVLKLINGLQKELYTSERAAAMEKAVHQTFDNMSKEIGVDPNVAKEIKKLFRGKLEVAFANL